MFIQGKTYRRSDIHGQYGGNPQAGISASAKAPFIFIFTGATGKQHGYKDKWENDNMFSYTGEGQIGDMEYTRGNLQLRDHIALGKRVFLFEYVRKGYVQFVSEVEYFNSDVFSTHDRNRNQRMAIKFFMKRVGVEIGVTAEQLELPMVHDSDMSEYRVLIPNETERQGLVTSRVGQGAYRKSILHRWEYKCAVTKFDNPKVLIASHILPWSLATDEQRLDVDNGILLSPTFDALFDRNMISFDEKGKILLGKEIQNHQPSKLGISGNETIVGLNNPNQQYLEYHRKKLA